MSCSRRSTCLKKKMNHASVRRHPFLFADYRSANSFICFSTEIRFYGLTTTHRASHRYWVISAKTISTQDSSAQIILLGLLRIAFCGNNFYFGTYIEVKRTVSENHNQLLPECNILKDCEGISKLKGMPGNITIKQSTRKYIKQKYCQGV